MIRKLDDNVLQQIVQFVHQQQYTGKSAYMFLVYSKIPPKLTDYFYVIGEIDGKKVWTLQKFPAQVLKHESQLEPFAGYDQLFLVERESKSGGALTSIAAEILFTKKVFLDNFSFNVGRYNNDLIIVAMPHVDAPHSARLFLLELTWMMSYQFGAGSSFEYQSVTNLLAKYKR